MFCILRYEAGRYTAREIFSTDAEKYAKSGWTVVKLQGERAERFRKYQEEDAFWQKAFLRAENRDYQKRRK